MLRSIAAVSVLLPLAIAQTPPVPPPAPSPAPMVEVPTFGNATCPIMGKKVSMPLFVDTELGRFYVCCKPCIRKIQADLPTAHKTAYPNVQAHDNATCPVSGRPIAGRKNEVTLQGHRFAVCSEACIATARQHSQTTLVKLLRAGVRDVGNATCPLTKAQVAANSFALIGSAIVHLAAGKGAADVTAPAAVLAEAEAIARAQPKPEPKPEPKK